jgi:hypothetical protein
MQSKSLRAVSLRRETARLKLAENRRRNAARTSAIASQTTASISRATDLRSNMDIRARLND